MSHPSRFMTVVDVLPQSHLRGRKRKHARGQGTGHGLTHARIPRSVPSNPAYRHRLWRAQAQRRTPEVGRLQMAGRIAGERIGVIRRRGACLGETARQRVREGKRAGRPTRHPVLPRAPARVHCSPPTAAGQRRRVYIRPSARRTPRRSRRDVSTSRRQAARARVAQS